MSRCSNVFQQGYDRLAPDRVAEVQARVLELHALAGGAKLSASEVFLPMSWRRVVIFAVRELEVLIVAGSVALFGYLNHLPAYLRYPRVVRLTAKDEDHIATNAIFFGLPWFAICYIGAIGRCRSAVWTRLGCGVFNCFTLHRRGSVVISRSRVRCQAAAEKFFRAGVQSN